MSEKDPQLSFEDVAAAETSETPVAPVTSETQASPEKSDSSEPAEASATPGAETLASSAADEAGGRDTVDPVAETDTPAGDARKRAPTPAGDNAAKPLGVRRELIKPGKIFYKMGDVCEITGLEPHVLRFWEAEFDQLQPKKNRSGHRIYTVEDIELVICIRRLLHEEGYTIPGARKKLEDPAYESGENHRKPREMQFILNEISGIRQSLESAIKLLDGP